VPKLVDQLLPAPPARRRRAAPGGTGAR